MHVTHNVLSRESTTAGGEEVNLKIIFAGFERCAALFQSLSEHIDSRSVVNVQFFKEEFESIKASTHAHVRSEIITLVQRSALVHEVVNEER